jgi:RNA binding exosome subunit
VAVFHYLHLRAFAHQTEDPDKVKTALVRAAQAEPGKLEVTTSAAEGSHGNRIVILDAEQRSAPATKRLFEALLRDDPAGFRRMVDETPRRLDEHLNFHFRLDKQEAFLGRLRLATDEDAITLRGKLRSFAPKRSGIGDGPAIADLTTFLQGLLARGSP